jgi:hypothetical protein
MGLPDPNSAAPEPSPSDQAKEVVPAHPGRRQGLRILAFSVVAGLAAGLLAWAIGETRVVNPGPVENQANFMGTGFMIPQITHEARLEGVRVNATRANAVVGGLTGLLLGLVGGAAIGPGRRAALAGGVGLVVGGLAGAVVTWTTMPLFEEWRAPDTAAVLPSLVMHGLFWLPAGVAGGLALGLGLRDRVGLAVAGGAMGALLATVLYEVVGALAFPLAGTGEPVSTTWLTRLLARLLVATFTAVAAALVLSPRVPKAEVGAPAMT